MEGIFQKKAFLIIFSIIILSCLPASSHSAQYHQLTGLIDLRSTFSDGALAMALTMLNLL